MTRETSESFRRGLWAVVALPAVLSAWMVAHFGVDVPFWDEWTIATFLQRIDDGTLTFAALFAQHNEHRMLVPRIVQLLAALTGTWDTRVGMWLTQGLLVAMMAGCVTLWRPTTRPRYSSWMLLSLSLVSLILFSPAQHQNLFWGFQFSFYIPAACLLASTIVAAAPAIGLGRALTLIAILSSVATFSLFPGLMTWPLGAASVLLVRGHPRRDDWWKWCGWAACCGGVILAYFLNYEPPPAVPSVWPALGDPRTLAGGVAACIGAFMGVGAQPVALAIVTGAAIAGSFLSLVATLWRRRADAPLVAAAAPWIVMGSFGLLTAIAIAIGRVGYGYVALVESRYAAFTGWILIGILMVAATLRDHLGTIAARQMWRAAAVLILALSAIGLPYQLTSVQRGYHERLQSLALYTFAEAAPRAVPLLPPWLDWPAFRQTLLHIERSGWRKTRPASPIWIDDDRLRAMCGFGSVEFLTAAGHKTMAGGWAYLPSLDRPADAILATRGASRRIVVAYPPLIGRRDIGERFQSEGALVTGWTVEAPDDPDAEAIEFWALDVSTLRASALCGPE